jgi:hypothetical protein
VKLIRWKAAHLSTRFDYHTSPTAQACWDDWALFPELILFCFLLIFNFLSETNSLKSLSSITSIWFSDKSKCSRLLQPSKVLNAIVLILFLHSFYVFKAIREYPAKILQSIICLLQFSKFISSLISLSTADFELKILRQD